MKIAIIGTRGIPNRYGGFEQLAEQLSVGLLQKGYNVSVYNSHNHPNQKKEWNGIQIIHCYDAEHWLGTAGQFIYDLNCIRNARKNDFDVILFLGYTSSSIWCRLFPKNATIISNMDGLEWKRSKYSKTVRWFLKYAEKLAVRNSDYLIADSPVIQEYLKDKYKVQSEFIPYGAITTSNADDKLLASYKLRKQNYFMLMARMEPENNIAIILEGFHRSLTDKIFFVLGSTANHFGQSMVKKFATDKRICFAGAIYDITVTHTLRTFCCLYFHGHSVGGTNPSLLEAMADKALIAAHDNGFNRAVLQKDAYYFTSAADVQQLVQNIPPAKNMIENNSTKINEQYNWPAVIEQYDKFISDCYNQTKNEIVI